MFLSSNQVSFLTNVPLSTIRDNAHRYIKPFRVGNKSEPHVWTRQQALAIGVASVLRRMGITGVPIRNAANLISSLDEQQIDLTFESRPVLLVVPGKGVLSALVSRGEVNDCAEDYLEAYGVLPLGIDLEKMWRKLNQQIEHHEKNGWEKQGVA